MNQENRIKVGYTIDPKTREPATIIKVGGQEIRLTCEEATSLGVSILNVTATAEQDAFLLYAFQEHYKMDDDNAMHMLELLKRYRHDLRQKLAAELREDGG
jgi:hypothetical protein